MTRRIDPTTKAARRYYRSYLHAFGGKGLTDLDRARVIGGFIKQVVIELDRSFAGALDSEDIIGIDVLLKSTQPAQELEVLALKLAELLERLKSRAVTRPSTMTIH